jgi:hypothetical protein
MFTRPIEDDARLCIEPPARKILAAATPRRSVVHRDRPGGVRGSQ